MAGSNERYGKICERMWYMLEDEKQNRGAGGKVEVEWGTRKTVDTLDSRLYHLVTVSG